MKEFPAFECACVSIGRMEDIHKAFPGGRGKGTLAVYTPIGTENVAENVIQGVLRGPLVTPLSVVMEKSGSTVQLYKSSQNRY